MIECPNIKSASVTWHLAKDNLLSRSSLSRSEMITSSGFWTSASCIVVGTTVDLEGLGGAGALTLVLLIGDIITLVDCYSESEDSAPFSHPFLSGLVPLP